MNAPSDHRSPRGAGPATHTRSATEIGLDALEWAVARGTAAEVVRRAVADRRRRVRWRLIGGVAGLALSATAAWLSLDDRRGHSGPTAPRTSAIVIVPPSRILADGSVVELRAEAAIAVEFSSAVRRVVLRGGEAHFQVSRDSSRPFVVAAGGVEVRAVGTAFSVDFSHRAVDVVVTEGRVAVGRSATVAASPASRPAEVSAGHQFIVPHAAAGPVTVRPLPAQEQRQRLGWRVPLLEFAGTPLAEAIALFNRHGGQRFVLGTALGHLQLSGTMRADDTESLLTLLRNEFGITAAATPDGRIELRR